MPSMQETFDTVVTHLRRQGAKAEIHGASPGEKICAYRAIDGKRCAVGCLIPDDRYRPSFEYTVVGGTEATHNDRANAVTRLIEELGHEIDLVIALQNVHDDAEVAQWERRLDQVAQDFGLNKPPS